MRVLCKEEYLSSDDLPRFPVPLDEEVYGKDVGFFVRAMGGEEHAALQLAFNKLGTSDPGEIRAVVLMDTVVDEMGAPIFDEEDKPRLKVRNAAGLEKLYKEALLRNGLTEAAIEETGKNSETSPDD